VSNRRKQLLNHEITVDTVRHCGRTRYAGVAPQRAGGYVHDVPANAEDKEPRPLVKHGLADPAMAQLKLYPRKNHEGEHYQARVTLFAGSTYATNNLPPAPSTQLLSGPWHPSSTGYPKYNFSPCLRRS
jgi:hypothetical protein